MTNMARPQADRAGGPSALSPSGSQSETLIPRANHTPGPWSYRPYKHDDWGTVRGPDDGVICQARDPGAVDAVTLAKHRERGTDPWEANARLIAAAPELLEALEELTGDYTGGAEHALADEYVVERALAAIAIAKAQGETAS